MAAKKDTKKIEPKNDDKPMSGEPWKDESWRRHEVVDPKLVLSALEKNGLKVAEKELDRTADLSSFYVHEKQKKTMKLARCVPNDADDPLGCGFMSDETLDSCPFCGSGDEIVSVPKEAPKADRDVELNVKAAEKKIEDKKSGGAVKVTSKDVKAKKKERGEVVEEKPTEPAKEATKPDAIVPAKLEAIDLPSENVGGTAADLDRICLEIVTDLHEHAKTQAAVMWRIGKRFSLIRDKKLWSTVRREDGGFDYANFGSFVAQRFADFDFTPDHAMLLIRIAGEFTQEQATGLGPAKAKAILDAKNSKHAQPITEEQKNELILLSGELSLSELRAKIKRMQLPQLPAAPTGSVGATSTEESDDEDRDDEDADDEDDEDDDDENDDDPDSSRSSATKPAVRQPQMTSVSFEKKEFSIPLVQKGSQIKAAKKIQDEPHGTLSVPGGTKIHFVLKIGDDGQIFVEGKIETPY
jgi:hypothetical protein